MFAEFCDIVDEVIEMAHEDGIPLTMAGYYYGDKLHDALILSNPRRRLYSTHQPRNCGGSSSSGLDCQAVGVVLAVKRTGALPTTPLFSPVSVLCL